MKKVILTTACLIALTGFSFSQTIYDSHYGASAVTWAASEGWGNIQNLGGHYIRMPMEIQKGVIVDNFFLTQYDNYVTAAQNNNMIVYGIINPRKNGSNQFPTATEFYNAVKTIIEHYDGDGTSDMSGLTIPIKNWEVCNEVIPGTGLYQGFSISDYLNFADSSGLALDQACSDCQFFNGAQVGPPVSGSAQSFSTSTLDDLIAGEGTGIIDAISYHDYLEYFEIDSAVSDFTALLIQDKPIWLTEAGMQEEYVANNALSQDDNARLFVRSSAYAFYKGVDKIIYASVRAQTIDPDYVKWQSLLDPSTGSKRKVYYAFMKMIEKTDYFTSVDTVAPHNGTDIFAYKFTVNSQPVYMLWATTSKSVNLQLSSPSVQAVQVTNSVPDDTLGNFTTQYLFPGGGLVALNIGPEAIYVEEEYIPGFNEITSGNSLNIYPNPAKQFIYLQLPANSEVEIFNSEGQQVDNVYSAENNLKIDVNNLEAGVYLVKATSTKGAVIKKFVKIF